MASKPNTSSTLLRLDLLEVKYLENLPRYHKTKQLLGAKNNQKLLKKLPATRQDALTEILTLKTSIFDLKYYGCHRKVSKEVRKIIKADFNRFSKANEKPKLVEFLKDEQIIETLITSKLVKLIQSTILTSKELKTNPPKYISETVFTILTDKSNPANPSKFFIDHCQKDKEVNSYVSNLWNKKEVKKASDEAEWSFRLVRGNVTKQEKDSRRKSLGKAVKEQLDSESEDEEEEDEDEDEEDSEEAEAKIPEDILDDENFRFYDNNSDSEQVPELDPNVDYNQVTDEEPSELEEELEEEDDDDEEERGKKRKASEIENDDFFAGSSDEEDTMETKYNLPQLAGGYYSGGSDDEDNYNVDDDSVVKKATTQRKNRRGQRARQKIWEKKYGTKAKHKQKEITAINDDRQRRKLEYEERVRKREEYAKQAMENAPSGSNTEPLGTRSSPAPEKPAPKEHPSWQAKKLADEKLKNVKFSGKKITFD